MKTGLALKEELDINQQRRYQNTKQQQALIDWAGNRNWDLFVTLTFKNKVSEKVATKTLNAFFEHLSRKCYGRKNKEIKRIPVLEHTANASHFHIVLEKPENWNDDSFKKIARDCWVKLKGTGTCNLVLRNNGKGSSWYEGIRNRKEDMNRVIGYMTKRLNSSFDTLDINGIRF